MMKLVNRLLIIAVMVFGVWFVVRHWDSVETPVVENGEDIVFEVEEGDGELVLDIESDLSLEEQLDALRQESSTTLVPVEKKVSSTKIYKKVVEKKEVVFIESEVKVYLFDGGMDLSVSTVPAGRVTFIVRNDGRVSHDFSVKNQADFGRITPGSSHTFELVFTEGDYVLYSPRELDQKLNMYETLHVENSK
jgi:hypothetical protein